MPVLYCVTLWGACFLHFLQKFFLALGMFTCVEEGGEARQRQVAASRHEAKP